MNTSSWRRLGTHRTTVRGTRVLVCQGRQLWSWQRWRCPLLTCDPRMSLKKQDNPAWSQVLRMQLAALHHSADASRRPVHPRRAVWHPGSEQPVYHALPAQRPCLLATHNILVQKTTSLLMLEEHGSYYNKLGGQAAHTVRLKNMYII